VRGPTPHSFAAGSGARNSRTWPSGTTSTPSGLQRSEAILAANFTSAMPTLAVSCVRSRMRARMARACSSGGPSSVTERVTSRNASSSESPSTSGVKEWKTSNTWSLTAL
jgi:hypothetical protein